MTRCRVDKQSLNLTLRGNGPVSWGLLLLDCLLWFSLCCYPVGSSFCLYPTPWWPVLAHLSTGSSIAR